MYFNVQTNHRMSNIAGVNGKGITVLRQYLKSSSIVA